LCPIPMSKGSRINSTLAPERYSAIELLVRFSSTPRLSPLHFAVEWATHKRVKLGTFCSGSHSMEINNDVARCFFFCDLIIARWDTGIRLDPGPRLSLQLRRPAEQCCSGHANATYKPVSMFAWNHFPSRDRDVRFPPRLRRSNSLQRR
jgi:hypothetical protein